VKNREKNICEDILATEILQILSSTTTATVDFQYRQTDNCNKINGKYKRTEDLTVETVCNCDTAWKHVDVMAKCCKSNSTFLIFAVLVV